MNQPSPSRPKTKMTSAARPAATEPKKPSTALAIATALGLGYLPKAPGTFGSLGGVALYAIVQYYFPLNFVPGVHSEILLPAYWLCMTALPVTLVLALIGVWSASKVATFSGKKDPQFVVIDEVSGQHLTYFFSLTLLNWKYLLLGFILFRVFDIWKPFPARQAESLPGGLGIMADDWIAGIYAALALWIARALGM
jgi:phosphatidylglycerophosphatase A